MAGESINTEQRFTGIAASPGVARGNLLVVNHEELSVPAHAVPEGQIGREITRLEEALVRTREQILEIQERLKEAIGAKDASVFDAHLLMLEDVTLIEAVKQQLHLKKQCVEHVFQHVVHRFAQSLRASNDTYLQERATDILDVGRRVVANMMGRDGGLRVELQEPCIILAHDLTPADTAVLDRSKVLGFATDLGAPVGHAAIMARALNVPAVVGLRNATMLLESGLPVVLDGYAGVLTVHPSPQTLFTYGEIQLRRRGLEDELAKLRDTPPVTRDGHRVILSANVELPEDLDKVVSNGAEGIGLYRTEFLFLNRADPPDEEEQRVLYRRAVEACAPHPVIFRTLDVGGDKMWESQEMPEEMNPVLGWRGIRFSLGRPDLFRTQLRAMVRAAEGNRVRVMFPMITVAEELRESKRLLQEVIQELGGVAPGTQIEVGAMIEVPAAALDVERLAAEVDFLSIGTNDLIQYTMAVDRTNDRVAYLYQPTHPAVVRLIARVIEMAHARGIWVGVCGEMAGDVLMTPLLLGLGIDELSMGSVQVPRVKRAIQRLSWEESTRMAKEWLGDSSGGQIRGSLLQLAQQYYPELLD